MKRRSFLVGLLGTTALAVMPKIPTVAAAEQVIDVTVTGIQGTQVWDVPIGIAMDNAKAGEIGRVLLGGVSAYVRAAEQMIVGQAVARRANGDVGPVSHPVDVLSIAQNTPGLYTEDGVLKIAKAIEDINPGVVVSTGRNIGFQGVYDQNWLDESPEMILENIQRAFDVLGDDE